MVGPEFSSSPITCKENGLWESSLSVSLYGITDLLKTAAEEHSQMMIKMNRRVDVLKSPTCARNCLRLLN